MKTPMQEMLEWVRATIPMDLDTPRMIEQKIESMLEKEKEVIMDAHIEGQRVFDKFPHTQWTNDQAEQYYNETFNTNQENLPDNTNSYTYYPQKHKTVFNTK